jgi:hypothetical protein
LVDDSPIVKSAWRKFAAMGKDVVMKSIGWLLVILGAGSFVLNLIGYEFELLMWIDNWGVEVGWAIRGAMVVVGGGLLFLGMKSEAAEAPAEPAEPYHSEPQETELQGFEPEASTEKE